MTRREIKAYLYLDNSPKERGSADNLLFFKFNLVNKNKEPKFSDKAFKLFGSKDNSVRAFKSPNPSGSNLILLGEAMNSIKFTSLLIWFGKFFILFGLINKCFKDVHSDSSSGNSTK